MKSEAVENVMSPETRARVDALQARIAAAGIKDLKFTRDPDRWNAMTADQRAAEICDVLESYLDGKCRPIPAFLPWHDAGYLGNGNCSFMRQDGWSCARGHGHPGPHRPLSEAP